MTAPSPYSVVDIDAFDAISRSSVRELLDRCQDVDGRPPLSDHALSAATHRTPTARAFVVLDRSLNGAAYAQATPTAEPAPTWTLDIAIDPHSRADRARILDTACATAIEWVRARGAASVQWWCHEATATDRTTAERHGLLPTRQLLEMQTPLGAAPPRPSLPTREFITGVDESALLEVNNLAFERHPDQGNWTHASLEARFASDWFDPTGLLVHIDDCGTMLGFCWTKVHRSRSSPIGEIYVLAVRPSHHGQGLGRTLAEAGLQTLRDRGIERAMLFVDRANTSACALYERLGFTITSTTTAFSASR